MANEMITASIPQEDMKELIKQISRAEKVLGKDLKSSVQWAGNFIATSLGAVTKKSKTKRKVEERKDGRWKTDKRVGRWGTWKYRNGEKVWVPISRTGEYGRVKFVSKKSARMMVWDKESGKVYPVEWTTGNKPEDDMPGIMQSPKLIIARSGLAKRSWKFLKARMRVGGSITDSKTRTGKIGAVVWRDIGGANPTLIINNDLRYAMSALRGGQSDLQGVMGKAARNMGREINRLIAKKVFG